MKYSNHINQAIHRQAGGALLVAMILIFMLSIMGISSMRGSTLEKRMATNSIQAATTFQGAESASEMAINDEANMTSALNKSNPSDVKNGILDDESAVEVDVELHQNIGLESSADLIYVGDGPAYGYSSNFVAYRFEIVGRAEVQTVRAKSNVAQGAYRIAPGR